MYSQCNEDRFLNDEVFKDLYGGTFVEVGVGLDGIFQSNTAFFEKERMWRGLLVEPVAESCARIKQNRNAIVECCAVGCHFDMLSKFFVDTKNPDVSGYLRDDQQPRLIPNVPLELLLREHRIGDIDLLSVDTEGTELDVLKSVDWRRRQIRAVVAEWNTLGIPSTRTAEMVNFMKGQYYKLVKTTEFNLIFLPE